MSIQMTQEVHGRRTWNGRQKRYGRIQHAPYSIDLAPLDIFVFSPTEIGMESGLVIWMNYAQNRS